MLVRLYYSSAPVTRHNGIRVLLAQAAGDAVVPSGNGTFTFKSQDGTTDRVVGTLTGTARNVTSMGIELDFGDTFE